MPRRAPPLTHAGYAKRPGEPWVLVVLACTWESCWGELHAWWERRGQDEGYCAIQLRRARPGKLGALLGGGRDDGADSR